MKILSIDIDWLLPGSRYHLKELNNLFFSKCETVEQIVFGRHHHQILQCPKVIECNNIILHNIDHHHDLVYQPWQEEAIKKGLASHGSWVGNLIYENKIDEYFWYKNIDSDLIIPECFLAKSMMFRQPQVKYYTEETLEEAWRLDYDLIFVAFSPEHLDEKLYCVYDTYVDYCKYRYKEKTIINKVIPDLPNTPLLMSWINKNDKNQSYRYV